jgi:cellobiose epimerase
MLVWRLMALLLVWPLMGAAALPTSIDLQRDAERCRRILSESLIGFYLPDSLDLKHGGYKESLKDNQFILTGEKFLTHQARQIWFFSTLAREGHEKEAALEAARHGFDFLEAHMRDRQFGGYFSKVTDAGEIRDPRKHAYLNAFALYGLAAFHGATKDPGALKAAQDLFADFERHCYDGEFGGYQEFFYRDWTPVTDPSESGYVGAIGHKTYNTHLHLLEAFAELYRVWPEALVAQRLQELIAINSVTVRYPRVDANVDAWLRDWTLVETPRNLRASYGHDVECVWLVMDAVRTLGWSTSLFRTWGESLVSSSIRWGYDMEHGGFYAGGPLGKPADDTRKTWWVQAEALVGLLEMYRLTRDPKYYKLFQQTLDFVERRQVAEEGSWWATRAADGSPTQDRQRSGPWHTAYHAGRAMMLSAKWLEELASRP